MNKWTMLAPYHGQICYQRQSYQTAVTPVQEDEAAISPTQDPITVLQAPTCGMVAQRWDQLSGTWQPTGLAYHECQQAHHDKAVEQLEKDEETDEKQQEQDEQGDWSRYYVIDHVPSGFEFGVHYVHKGDVEHVIAALLNLRDWMIPLETILAFTLAEQAEVTSLLLSITPHYQLKHQSPQERTYIRELAYQAAQQQKEEARRS